MLLNASMMLIKLNMFLTAVAPADEGKITDGVVINSIKENIVEFALWAFNGIINVLSPFIEWGCKSIIVVCIIIYFCTQDKKATSIGMKWFFVYLIFLMIRGAVR